MMRRGFAAGPARRNAITEPMFSKRTKIKLLLHGGSGSGREVLFQLIRFFKAETEDNSLFEEVRRKLRADILVYTEKVLDAMYALNTAPMEDIDFEDSAELVRLLVKALPPEDDQMRREVERERMNTDQMQPWVDYFDDDSADALRYLSQLPAFWDALSSHQELAPGYSRVLGKLTEGYPSWGGKGWKPKYEDIDIFSRHLSIPGFPDLTLQHNGREFRIVDAALHAEMRTPLQSFAEVPSIVFVASASAYDEFGLSGCELLDSVTRFQQLLTSDAIEASQVFLFISKIDEFKDKFSKRKVPINTTGLFPDAPKDFNDVEGALEYIRSLFIQNATRHIHVNDFDTFGADENTLEETVEAVFDGLLEAHSNR